MSFRLYTMLSLVCLLALTACSSTRGLYDAGAAAAGGMLASKLSDGDPLMTGVGAAGGVAVSEIAQTLSAKQGQKQYTNGYQQGRSDAVKQQYWLVQNLQKQPKTPAPQTAYLPITVPGATTNGVTTLPHTEYIRVER